MSDCVAANIASFRDSLAMPFQHSDHNGCLPHTGSHVGEHLETPHVDEFMGYYNLCVGQSNYAKVIFAEAPCLPCYPSPLPPLWLFPFFR